MESPRWDELRKARLKIANYQCENCKSRVPLQVHHKTYKRFGGNERMSDLLALCSTCHKAFDEKRKKGKSQRTKKRKFRSRSFEIRIKVSKYKNWGEYTVSIIEGYRKPVIIKNGNTKDSINRLALTAAIEAIKILPKKKRIAISNKYVYNSLTAKNPKANLDLIEELKKITKTHKITLI